MRMCVAMQVYVALMLFQATYIYTLSASCGFFAVRRTFLPQ